MAPCAHITKSNTAPAVDCQGLITDVWEEITTLRHLALFLVSELESGLDPNRGRRDEHGSVTLVFQEDGIEAKIWLSSEVWKGLRRLDKRLLDFQNARSQIHEVAA